MSSSSCQLCSPRVLEIGGTRSGVALAIELVNEVPTENLLCLDQGLHKPKTVWAYLTTYIYIYTYAYINTLTHMISYEDMHSQQDRLYKVRFSGPAPGPAPRASATPAWLKVTNDLLAKCYQRPLPASKLPTTSWLQVTSDHSLARQRALPG